MKNQKKSYDSSDYYGNLVCVNQNIPVSKVPLFVYQRGYEFETKGLGFVSILYVLAVIMAGMTAASWFWNPIIFFIELALTLISIAIITVIFVQFKSHVTVAMKSANKILSGREYQLLQDFTLPVAIVGNEGDIIWVNTAFLMDVGRDSEYRGENILKLIQSKTMEQVAESDGTDISIDDKNSRYLLQNPICLHCLFCQ